MKKWLVIGLVFATVGVSSQVKRVIVVQPFTLAAGVELPYDMKTLFGGWVGASGNGWVIGEGGGGVPQRR